MTGVQGFLDQLGARKQLDAEPSWIAARRQAGAARFEAVGFPNRKNEEWKYTDVSAIAKQQFALTDNADFDRAQLDAMMLEIDAYRMVFVDGVFSAELSSLEGLEGDVSVEPLSQALASNHEAVGGALGRLNNVDFSAFSALNAAFTAEGAIVRIGRRVALDKPVYLLFVSRKQDAPVMTHPRVIIEAGSQSEATIIEHYIGEEGAANLTNVVSELFVEKAAHLVHYKLQEASTQEFHIASVHIEQARDSHYRSFNLNLGGSIARNDLVAELNDENAVCDYYGLFFGRGRQHMDNHTKVHHNAPRTYSNENYKGILDDRARGVFNGLVHIKRDAQQVRGYQNNANLLLSDRAEIDTKPELLIYADDVLCSHGTTTGQLDERAVFAMRARGLDEAMARGLLTLAFAGEVLDSVNEPNIALRVERAVAGKLPDRFNLQDLVEAQDA
ncbi:Fe-S cluster assembly protein SufD [Larsenimonas salina]|uniref:Fe-S cluster assembly protein SufD n=1 Tax=Larsenimonas salina TaxID=1295565 RepID=UPI002072B194|nr:Fe-S cluster assembly protein SufD [Larsenimonas salina]MCM5704793.1 Fe-S cluster assembly protein SufD [Larsenimonas salina]